MINRRDRTDKEVRSVKTLSKHFEQIAEDKNGGDQNKPVVTSVDGTHVKNRKQFFEEQAHASENTNNIRNKTGE